MPAHPKNNLVLILTISNMFALCASPPQAPQRAPRFQGVGHRSPLQAQGLGESSCCRTLNSNGI